MKEVRLTPQIDPHDLSIKLKKVREFLERGDKVTISVRFRGRQMRHREIGTELMKAVIEQLGDEAKIDRHPSFEGRRPVDGLHAGAEEVTNEQQIGITEK